MAERLVLMRDEDLSVAQRRRLNEIDALAFRPTPDSEWPPEAWARLTVRALVFDGERIVTHAGGVTRTVSLDDRPTHIGGIGGVMTEPAARRCGHASAAANAIHKLLVQQERVAFTVLFCPARLCDFYARLGWHPFDGAPIVEHRGARIPFSYNRTMVRDGLETAAARGSLDLRGPPW